MEVRPRGTSFDSGTAPREEEHPSLSSAAQPPVALTQLRRGDVLRDLRRSAECYGFSVDGANDAPPGVVPNRPDR